MVTKQMPVFDLLCCLISRFVRARSRSRVHSCVCRVEGFKEAAEKFEQEAGISSPLKLNTLGNRIKVIEAVQSGKMQEAITLINQLYPGLLDDDRDLYFHLQVSMFILHTYIYILFYSS